jgi:hypothetical protein
MSAADAFHRHHVSSNAADGQDIAKKAPAEAVRRPSVTPHLELLISLTPLQNLRSARLRGCELTGVMRSASHHHFILNAYDEAV